MEEVAVVGAGTAGLIAARQLSRYGIGTTIYDQKPVPGVPARASGILSLSGLSTLGIGYRGAVTNVLSGAVIHAGAEEMHIDAKQPIAVVLDRKRLNRICLEEAEAAGAKVVLNKKKVFSAGEERPIVVGADGAVSSVARQFRMGSIDRYALTYKAIYRIKCANPHSVELFFDSKLMPGLFGWTCPNSREELEVGIGVQNGRGNAKRVFDAFVKKPVVAEIISGAKIEEGHASMIPMVLRKRIVDEKGKVLLVGDAAGQVKPTTGGGIIYGGNGAIMAAEAINDYLEKGTALSAYEAAYKKRYATDTRVHTMVNKFYSSLDEHSIARLLRACNILHLDKFLGRYGDMDMPSRILRNVIAGRREVHVG